MPVDRLIGVSPQRPHVTARHVQTPPTPKPPASGRGPSSFELVCACGERYHVDDAHIGKKLKCRCGRTIDIARPSVPLGERLGRGAAAASGGAARGGSRLADRLARLVTRGIPWRASLPWAAPDPARRPRVFRSARRYVTAARGAAWLVWAYLLVTVLAVVVLQTTGDRWSVGTALLFGPRWILLLPLAALVPAALLLRRALLLPLAGAALVVLFPFMGLRANPGAASWLRGPGRDLRVVTFNAEGGEFAGMILGELLEEWEADVVAFQECGPDLQGAIRLQKAWHHHDDGVGLCLLSRWPITEAQQIDRKAFERVRDLGLGGSSDAVRYTIAAPGRSFAFTNVHLETPRKGINMAVEQENEQVLEDNTSLRKLESRLAREWADKARGPLLVAGDFNMPVESAIYRASWGDLTNAFSAAGNGFGLTKHNGWIRVRIDHVLAGDGWRVVGARLGRELVSDHVPVIVDLRRDVD